MDCTDHGQCIKSTHTCICDPGWQGDGCHISDCPGAPEDCFGRGICNTNLSVPLCVSCIDGWMGPDCNTPCEHGQQIPMDSGICICDKCYAGKSCDAECSGHGSCMDEICECDEGWWGEKCSTRGCPGVGTSCSYHGTCNSALQECTCTPGWTGKDCNEPDCPGGCAGNGFCNGTGRAVPECQCHEVRD